jgi:hypothetical protein
MREEPARLLSMASTSKFVKVRKQRRSLVTALFTSLEKDGQGRKS